MCFDPRTAAQINLAIEWSSWQEAGEDGFCFDNQGRFPSCQVQFTRFSLTGVGIGYAAGHNFISCVGCMKYVCTYRPCEDRDGSRFKLFWVLESVDRSCCQDCTGNIIPPNKVFSTTKLENECEVLKHSICQTNSGEGTGEYCQYI